MNNLKKLGKPGKRPQTERIRGTDIAIDKAREVMLYNELVGMLEQATDTQPVSLDFFTRVLHRLDAYVELYAEHAKCQRGCSYCCASLPVDVFPVEYQNIARFIRTELLVEQQANILRHIEGGKRSHPDYFNAGGDFETLYRNYRMPCIFLDEARACMIYPVRPIVCRTYLSFTDPALCDDDDRAVKHTFKLIRAQLLLFMERHHPYEDGEQFHFDTIPHWFSDFTIE